MLNFVLNEFVFIILRCLPFGVDVVVCLCVMLCLLLIFLELGAVLRAEEEMGDMKGLGY